MLTLLYIASMAGAVVSGLWQARIILANRPIRHGWWLCLYLVAGYGLAAWILGPWWGIAAVVGMGGMFSLVFRAVLNHRRGLPWEYMGPPATITKGRSSYDRWCWQQAERLGVKPVWVATTLEEIASVGVAVLFWLRAWWLL